MDDLLPQIGEFGRYQKILLWLVCLPACIPCGFCAFNQLFMADTPAHWCRNLELEGLLPNMSQEHRRMLSIPNVCYSYMHEIFKYHFEFKYFFQKKKLVHLKILIIFFLFTLKGGLNGTFSSCERYSVDWKSLLRHSSPYEVEPNSSWITEPCQDGWEYDTSEIKSSIVIDVCISCQSYTNYTYHYCMM